MRAISVRQPWAELIAAGKKKIEYRTWQVSFRGDLLIVASASRHDDDCADEGVDPDRLVYGAAVCVVDLWKVSGDLYDYKWHLRNPRRVEPVRVKGYAAIYNVDDALVRFASPMPSVALPVSTKRPAIVRGAGHPRVVIATPDQRLRARWKKALEAAGYDVIAFRDGYGAWLDLAVNPAACTVLDADVQGYPVAEVLERLRTSGRRAAMPVVVAGAAPRDEDPLMVRVKRGASADDIVQAVTRSLGAHDGVLP